MALFRAVLLTTDEEHELLRLNAEFQGAQTATHDSAPERDACDRIIVAQRRIAEAHGLGPLYGGMGYSRLKDGSWTVGPLIYPLTPHEEHQVRGLG